MRFLTLATSATLGLLALVGVQSSARAHEYYRYHVTRFEHRDRDRDRFHFIFHYREHRDHDRR